MEITGNPIDLLSLILTPLMKKKMSNFNSSTVFGLLACKWIN